MHDVTITKSDSVLHMEYWYLLHMVDSAGFEPAASGLQSQRSYQLSYEPGT